MTFSLVMSEDGLPEIFRGEVPFARALTERDGKIIVEELNMGAAGMRDDIISAVTDAIEQAFEDKS